MSDTVHSIGSEAQLSALIHQKQVLVLCGAGGVGKTTASAAIALAGAQAGRRVLVLTIDPAKRLAEALGIPASAPRPTPVPRDRLEACGLTGPGTLDAWILESSSIGSFASWRRRTRSAASWRAGSTGI
jgi:hypothetical protein